MYAAGAVVVGVALFWGGMQYGSSSVSGNVFDRNGQRMGGAGRRGGNFMSGGFVTGEIQSKDDKSITVKMQDGSTRFVFFSASTKVSKSVDGTADDLAAGKQVTVGGTANADGSITAQAIQLRPAVPPQR